jgi:hypothetical protein
MLEGNPSGSFYCALSGSPESRRRAEVVARWIGTLIRKSRARSRIGDAAFCSDQLNLFVKEG